MVGIAGELSDPLSAVDGMRGPLAWTGREQFAEFEDDSFHLVSSTFPGSESQPVSVDGGRTYWWVIGDIYGIEESDGYRSYSGTPASNCAHLYDEVGFEFVPGLNGTFLAVAYETVSNTAYFITDRLGSHPLYYADTDGGFAFSTHVQALGSRPDIPAAVDPEYLAEYCSLGRVTGLACPLSAVSKLPPASISSFNLDTGRRESRAYWQPIYEPRDESFTYFQRRYTELLEQILSERLEDGRRYGLLLSGGSDSRLLLDAARSVADTDRIVAYHISDWMSEEARSAEQAAIAADVEFRWLRRQERFHSRVLDEAPRVMNFYGRFEQAHLVEFVDQLVDEVDTLVSGLYADSWFRAGMVPRHELSFEPLGTLALPVLKPTDSLETYLSRFQEEVPAYLDTEATLREILQANISNRSDGTIVDHGVVYPSIEELSMYGNIYPLWNDPDLFFWSLQQTMPHWTPFLDNRMVELALSVPVRYQVRKNLSKAALRYRDSPLTKIPDPETGVTPGRSFPVQFLSRIVTGLRRKFLDDDSPPEPYMMEHPWRDNTTALTHQEFPIETLRESQGAIDSLSFLNWKGVLDCYRSHLGGDQRNTELITLLGLLEMPIFDDISQFSEDGEPRTPHERQRQF